MSVARVGLWGVVALLTFAPLAAAQAVSQRGFVETRAAAFPQDAPNDSRQLTFDVLAREETFLKPTPWMQFALGIDARANTHDQVDGSLAPDFSDRGARRPAVSVRRLGATLTHGALTLDLGRQFIRWGKTDVMTPTDRFAPRDFLNGVDGEFLSVSGARAVVAHGANTLDLVWVPVFTPSRIPLLDQRWTATPAGAPAVSLVDAGGTMPTRSQVGVRWGRTAAGFEYSVSFFDGFSHLPNLDVQAPTLSPTGTLRVDVARRYPSLRAWGADAALPTRWATLKGEAAYFTSSDQASDEYVLYVVQAERQIGEWLLIGGYSGESVVHQRAAASFAPDRGLARAFVARASYTIDATRSVAVESALRQNGAGVYLKGEYSQGHGQHWRTTLGGVLLRGDQDDFLGRYRRNSHVTLALRYSF